MLVVHNLNLQQWGSDTYPVMSEQVQQANIFNDDNNTNETKSWNSAFSKNTANNNLSLDDKYILDLLSGQQDIYENPCILPELNFLQQQTIMPQGPETSEVPFTGND